MKHLFLGTFLVLIGASVVSKMSSSKSRSGQLVLYWVTDPNPARLAQVRLFQEWMARNHPGQQFDLRLDSANSDPSKKIIQGVSGVGDDIIDLGSGDVRYFQTIGILRDVTAEAHNLGFSTDHTYPALEPALCLTSESGIRSQYAFPCNATANLLVVNRQTLAQFGMPPLPRRWSFDEFEQLGKRFVAAANPDPAHRTTFFADTLPIDVLRRSLGLAIFNETGTRCILDRPENARVLELLHKWTYVDHLLPSGADQAAAVTMAGYSGSGPQMFNSGNYAMIWEGRYILIQLRKFDAARAQRGEPLLDLDVSECPQGGFPNTSMVTRAAAVYAGSRHPELAAYFLQFLASEDYNMEIVRDADSLPPNPQQTKVEAYLHPPDHPNEWRLHGAYAAAADLGICNSSSPFVLDSIVVREDLAALDAFMSDQFSAAQSGQREASRINAEIQRTLHDNPEMRERYEQLVQRQSEIDALLAAGKKVPLAWISEPFYRKFYQACGRAE